MGTGELEVGVARLSVSDNVVVVVGNTGETCGGIEITSEVEFKDKVEVGDGETEVGALC